MTTPTPASEIRQRDADRSQETILIAAKEEFSEFGFAGGRIDRIAERAGMNKRLIYYYFGNKDDLFLAVLERVYADIRRAEQALHLDEIEPVEALRRLVSFTWNYYLEHPEFITLLNDENLHRGKHIAKSLRAHDYSSPATRILDTVLASGAAQGVFRAGVSARDLYLMIASLNYFYLSNRHTLSAFFGDKLDSSQALQDWHAFAVDAVLRTVKP